MSRRRVSEVNTYTETASTSTTLTDIGKCLTYYQLSHAITDLDSGIAFSIQYKLLPAREKMDCIDCGAETTVGWQNRKKYINIPFVLKCAACFKETSVTKNTWYSNANITIQKSLQLVYLWLLNVKIEETAKQTDVNKQTVCDYFSFCREVCYVITTNPTKPIGGPGHIVEIDEMNLFSRKYKRGRVLDNENAGLQIWIFGGIDRETKECFITRLKSRTANTLLPIIRKFILPGSKVMTDGWKSYSTLNDEGYIQGVVNDSIEFVNQDDSEIHKTNVERQWGILKAETKSIGRPSDKDDLYFFEFIYRQQHKANTRSIPVDMFFAFLNDIAKVYPGYGKNGLQPCLYPNELKDESVSVAVKNEFLMDVVQGQCVKHECLDDMDPERSAVKDESQIGILPFECVKVECSEDKEEPDVDNH